MTALKPGSHVTHTKRGPGIVQTIAQPQLRGMQAKVRVYYERFRCAYDCMADELTVVPAVAKPGDRPSLALVEHAPVVA